MKVYQTFLAFVGNFSPIFFITYIVYIGYALSVWLIPVFLSAFCNIIWRQIFSEKNLKNCDKESYKISDTKNIGNDVIAYYLSYSIALPSVLFLQPVKGLLVLAIIMIIIYALSNEAKIMLFNPFLVLFGYKEMEIKTEKGAQIYLISKRRPKMGEELKVSRIHELLYYLNVVYDYETS